MPSRSEGWGGLFKAARSAYRTKPARSALLFDNSPPFQGGGRGG